MSISRYEFSMVSDPSCLNFHEEDWNKDEQTGVPIRNYAKILFKDSLFGFFPYSEIYYRDSGGQIVDNVFFVEGLEFKCKLGYIKKDEEKTTIDKTNSFYTDYLEHEYIWSANEINNIKFASAISGDNVFMMISKYFFNDYPKSKAFNHESSTALLTITQILKTKILPAWGMVNSKKYFISDSKGTPFLMQSNVTNKDFISKLAEYCYSQNSISSGYYTFINCNGDFYFMTLHDMLKQNPVMEYKIDLTTEMMTDQTYLKDYRVLQGGVPVNFDNYNRKVYRYKATGTSIADTRLITDAITDLDPNTKLLVRDPYIPKNTYTKVTYAGIQDETNGEELYKGFYNYYYRDTALCYRMVIVIDFNSNCVSGKTIRVQVNKRVNGDERAGEFEGNWIICESIHIMDRNGIPYTQLTISKPEVKIDSNHTFFKDFKNGSGTVVTL